jgi:hypothetical protein
MVSAVGQEQMVQEALKKQKINLRNFFFVDCVTKSITTQKVNPRSLVLLISSAEKRSDVMKKIEVLVDLVIEVK